MSEKIALVTGGTSGVGLSMVRALAEQGFAVHFIGTNDARGRALESELPGSRFIRLDLSSLAATRSFANAFSAEVPHLDVLANVAGVMLRERTETAESLEKTMAIGHFSAFLLSRELVPLLARARHGRVVNVSGVPSEMLRQRLDFNDLGHEQSYGGINTAFDTVHAKTVITQQLAAEFAGQGIDVNAFHPGAVRSDVFRDLPLYMRVPFSILSFFFPRRSRSGIYVATSHDIAGVTGQLFVGTKPRPLAFDDSYRASVWDWTLKTVDQALAA